MNNIPINSIELIITDRDTGNSIKYFLPDVPEILPNTGDWISCTKAIYYTLINTKDSTTPIKHIVDIHPTEITRRIFYRNYLDQWIVQLQAFKYNRK